MQKPPIAKSLDSIVLGAEISHGNLTMVPLMRRTGDSDESAAGYILLDEAIESGAVEITEVSEQGRVPELRVVNRGRAPVLIVDGEELVGAKQNRIVNLTILVAATSELTIPVSCVEAGRWRARSRTFTSAPRTQYAAGRARRMSQVTQSIQTRRTYSSDQSQVWADIAEKSERLKSSSPTGAMESLFVDHAKHLDDCVAACQPVDGQVGAMFTIAGRVVGFDLFDSEKTLRKLLPKLVRSVAIDALDSNSGRSVVSSDASGGRPDLPVQTDGQEFLSAAGAAPQHVGPAVGLGEDVRLSARELTGAALVLDRSVVHLSAFAL